MPIDKVYLGISLGSRAFSKDYLKNVLSHCSQRYKEVLFLIADEPHIYTFMATKSLDLENARSKIDKISDEKYILLKRIAQKYAGSNLKIDIKRWKEIAFNREYTNVLLSLYKIESVDIEFHYDLMKSFDNHMENVGGMEVSDDKRFMGSRYVIEECAMMLYLQESQGYLAQISPEEKPEIIAKFYNHQYRYAEEFFFKNKLEEVEHIVL